MRSYFLCKRHLGDPYSDIGTSKKYAGVQLASDSGLLTAYYCDIVTVLNTESLPTRTEGMFWTTNRP